MGRRGSRLVTVTSAALTLGCAGLVDTTSGPSSRITYRADQKCYREEPEDCPPDASCNPPPPEEVDCPPIAYRRIIPRIDGICLHDVELECPEDTSCSSVSREAGCPPSFVRAITRGDDGACTVQRELECPPDTACESPPPVAADCPSALTEPGTLSLSYVYGCQLNYEPVECPPEIALRPFPDSHTATPNGDGTCDAWYNGPFDCPPDATCNPPAPQKITCPPNMQ